MGWRLALAGSLSGLVMACGGESPKLRPELKLGMTREEVKAQLPGIERTVTGDSWKGRVESVVLQDRTGAVIFKEGPAELGVSMPDLGRGGWQLTPEKARPLREVIALLDKELRPLLEANGWALVRPFDEYWAALYAQGCGGDAGKTPYEWRKKGLEPEPFDDALRLRIMCETLDLEGPARFYLYLATEPSRSRRPR